MDETRARLLVEFHDKEARTDYADQFLDASIALQIATLRQERVLTQKQLGDLAGGMGQSRISAYEKVDYSSWSVRTLRRLAKAFDLPLVIRFESWGNFLDGVTKLSRRDLDRPSFEDDPVFEAKGGAAGPSAEYRSDSVSRVAEFKLPSTSAAFASLPNVTVGALDKAEHRRYG
ncbi:MAG: helix-turn-helix transcriptional regulator [bacterium]|nr:helix-turn-helix transcriptional regulator [bacterium]